MRVWWPRQLLVAHTWRQGRQTLLPLAPPPMRRDQSCVPIERPQSQDHSDSQCQLAASTTHPSAGVSRRPPETDRISQPHNPPSCFLHIPTQTRLLGERSPADPCRSCRHRRSGFEPRQEPSTASPNESCSRQYFLEVVL